ncbi:antitoxin VapB family protein [Haloarcula marismortui]|uniref:Uncharacterized protein n=2 Tax=Haloarcula marismortui ATCC 33800 TaxID=662476 RepID=A0A8T8KGE6_9EURY|nr:hypothetical protein KDQ40_17080 [Haloarcula sinaiiensis ATCC 33800]
MKRENESVTDVLLRMTGDEQDVMKGFGAWKDRGLREEAEATREELDEDFRERQDKLFGHYRAHQLPARGRGDSRVSRI